MRRAFLIAAALSTAASGAYTYYHTDNFGSAAAWVTNGAVTLGDGGLKATSGAGGSLISNLNVPDGTSEYEVRSTLTITADGGTYIQYLRASDNALSGPTDQGTYWAVEIQNPTFGAGGCSATLGVYKRIGVNRYQMGSGAIGCRNAMVVRSVFAANSVLTVFVDDQLKFAIQDATILTGKPGVGARSTPTGNAVWQVQLGGLDRVAPNSVHYQTFGSSVFSNLVDLQWQGVTDDANGIGVMSYTVVRNGTTVTNSPVSTYTDLAASPQTPYNYTVYAVDFHGNYSAGTTVSVMTPPLGSVDPRRVGVRPMGTYWGAGGENIDTYSANVNFTLPLVKAVGRGGWGVGFALSYNSQNWRKDQGGTWRLGRDVGYGFGWKLLAGSITPYWSDLFTIHHYIFTDSTGAEYRLDVNTGGVWTSKESIYLSYDSNEQLIRFNDGSWWQMGALSAGVEQDSGSRYPTRMQDSNGNQVFIRYRTGTGAGWANSSARIDEIEDVRALAATNPTRYRTYSFTYNTDPIPHLIGITSHIGSGENFTVEYHEDQAVSSPFSPAVPFGYFDLLRKVTFNGLERSHQFEYAEPGSSGLTKVTLPYGGYLRWEFEDFTNGAAITKREVKRRYLAMSAGVTEKLYTFTRPSSDSTDFKHRSMTVDDTGALARKKWIFRIDYTAAIGQIESFEEGTNSGTVIRRQDFSLSQDPAPHGRFYIGAVTTTLDPGTVSQVQSIQAQTLDSYGNVTQSSIYDWNQLGTAARTYTNTYLADANYTSRYIRNRLLTSTVTGAGQTINLVQNVYDQSYDVYAFCGNMMAIQPLAVQRNHDSGNYTQNFSYRGNISATKSMGVTVCSDRYITGDVRQTRDSAGTTATITQDSTKNYAVPSLITPNSNASLATAAAYDSVLAPTQITAPNSSVAAFSYDSYHRPSSTSSPHGASTTYSYSPSTFNPPWQKATTNGRWVLTILDGLGRTAEVDTGHGSTYLSVAYTEYEPSGCSPLGKVYRVSQPLAPEGIKYWTTYTYDSLGRPTRVDHPNGLGFTTYVYLGNAVTITDPAGKWKQYFTDAIGNLVTMYEPRPGGGANYQTSYTYNALNKLTGVSMPRDGVTQTRTFVYDSTTGRLTSETHPETLTTSYTYNTDGTVNTKTDAKGQETTFTYDSYKRVTRLNRTAAACEQIDYSYDSNPYDAGYSQNALGRLAAIKWGGDTCRGGQFHQMFSYSGAGSMIGKRLRVRRFDQDVNLDVGHAYDNEGRMVSVTYPSHHVFDQQQGYQLQAGLTYTYAFDSMRRPVKITDSTPELVEWVKGVQYGPAGETKQLQFTFTTGGPHIVENREYNARLQLTRILTAGVVDWQYQYANNDGRVSKMIDGVTGEEVDYQYDALGRLSSAVTAVTGPQWGLSMTYDGFGNRLTQTVTKGTGPALSLNYNGLSNRISTAGYVHDPNGNVTGMPGYSDISYDAANRLAQITNTLMGKDEYAYSADNKRVWKKQPAGTQEFYVYDAAGRRVGTYSITQASGVGPAIIGKVMTNVYFGSRLIRQGDETVIVDRLGTVRYRGTHRFEYFPYGEERTISSNDRDKFGTYHRDATTFLDYADQRYYGHVMARFLTPDPYDASARLENPGSWNRYAYVEGDPINYADPNGLRGISCDGGCLMAPPDDSGGGGGIIWMGRGSGYGSCSIDGASAPCSVATGALRTGAGIPYDGPMIVPTENGFMVPTVTPDGTLSLNPLDPPDLTGLGVTAVGSSISFVDESGHLVYFDENGERHEVEMLEAGLPSLRTVTARIYTVYRAFDKDGNVYYGITNNFRRRVSEHGTRFFRFEPLHAGLRHFAARAVEQFYIDLAGLANILNNINSIAKSNPLSGRARQAADGVTRGRAGSSR